MHLKCATNNPPHHAEKHPTCFANHTTWLVAALIPSGTMPPTRSTTRHQHQQPTRYVVSPHVSFRTATPPRKTFSGYYPEGTQDCRRRQDSEYAKKIKAELDERAAAGIGTDWFGDDDKKD